MSVIMHTFCEGCGNEVSVSHQEKQTKPCFICPPCEAARKEIPAKEPKALHEGFVSMQEILNGQRVTGEQFFNAYFDCIDSGDHGETYFGNNPKTMSTRQLKRAMEEVDDDRKQFFRFLRYKLLTKEDEFQMEAMNEWARKVWDELRSR